MLTTSGGGTSVSGERASFSEKDSFSEENFTSVEQYLILKINFMLGTPRENQITWNDWKELMVEILKSAAQREKQLISSRLDNIGSHKQSEETSSQLEVYRRAIIDAQSYYEQRIDSIAGKAFLHEQKLLRDFIKVESYNKKNTVKEWNNLYLELSNERGPWGTGMVDESNVSV
jgi:hypothetical protein